MLRRGSRPGPSGRTARPASCPRRGAPWCARQTRRAPPTVRSGRGLGGGNPPRGGSGTASPPAGPGTLTASPGPGPLARSPLCWRAEPPGSRSAGFPIGAGAWASPGPGRTARRAHVPADVVWPSCQPPPAGRPGCACAVPGVAGGPGHRPTHIQSRFFFTNEKAKPETGSHAEGHDFNSKSRAPSLASATCRLRRKASSVIGEVPFQHRLKAPVLPAHGAHGRRRLLPPGSS